MACSLVTDLIVTNGYVLTMDAARRMFADGAVAISGNKIEAVGRSDEILARYKASHVIDAKGSVVMPGLIDGHNHIMSYFCCGYGDEADIMSRLYDTLYPYETLLTPEEAYFSALGNYIEMIKNGTTCFNDPGGYLVDSLAQAAVDIGIRGIVNRSTRDIAPKGKPLPPQLFEDIETNLREAEKTVHAWNGAAGGRIRAWYSLRYIFNISDRLATGIRDLARRDGVGVHAHVAAVRGENEAVQQIFGKRSLERYYDLGLFRPNLYCVHMGFPNEREVDLLVRHGVKVTHCPSAAMVGAWGVIGNKMIPYMIEKGVPVSIGTDTAGAAGSLDMFRVMYVFATVHRDPHNDPTLIGAYKALEHATIVGAKACLWDDEIGSLEPGKKADLLLVDRSAPEWQHPGRDVVRSLVYSANGSHVDTVIIDGKIVMRHRALTMIDEGWATGKIRASAAAVRERGGFPVRTAWPVA